MIFLIGLLLYHVLFLLVSRFLPQKKSWKILEICLFLLPVLLICSLKGINIGLDTEGYLLFYNQTLTSLEGGGLPEEKGFVLFMYVFRKLNVPFFAFLIALFTIVLFGVGFFAYKKSENPLLVIFFILYFGLLGFSLSGIRQALAIGIILIGFAFYNPNKKISIIFPIIFTTIAVFFHKTSIFVYPLILILLLVTNLRPRDLIYVVLVSILIAICSPAIYAYVVENIGSFLFPSKSISMWTLLIYLLFGLLVYLLSNTKTQAYIRKKTEKFDDNVVFNRINGNEVTSPEGASFFLTDVVAFLIYPTLVLFIGVYSPVFSRVTYFTIAFTGVLLVEVINNSRNSKTSRSIMNILLVVFLVLYFWYSVLLKDPLSVSHYEFGPIMF